MSWIEVLFTIAAIIYVVLLTVAAITQETDDWQGHA
jgi:hypothetical protein